MLLNGAGALDVHWGHVIDRLSSQRTVTSLDYSGSGDTVDDGGVLTVEKLSRQVVGVAEAGRAETFDLIGYSCGIGDRNIRSIRVSEACALCRAAYRISLGWRFWAQAAVRSMA